MKRGHAKSGEAQAFIERVLATRHNRCVIWPYARDVAGYARVGVERDKADWISALASRVICERFRGKPPTAKHYAAHSCGKGHLGCVNPNHLDWKTPAENQADRIVHGTSNRGERNGMAKLTEREARLIKRSKLPGKVLALRFGVSQPTITRVRRDPGSWVAKNARPGA